MRARLIPVLTMDGSRRLVKTIGFKERTYVGDPFNVIRLFNEKMVDEVVLLDIDATKEERTPDVGFLGELASECFIPLAYGGGLKSISLCERLAPLGVEKFVLGTAARKFDLLASMSNVFGSQATVVCVDCSGQGVGATVHVSSGSTPIGLTALEYARKCVDAGCGEVILNSIDRDGTRLGYDLELVGQAAKSLSVPVIALGGAGTYQHLAEGIKEGISAVASGSVFTFIGDLRAVLVNYSPELIEND